MLRPTAAFFFGHHLIVTQLSYLIAKEHFHYFIADSVETQVSVERQTLP